MKRSVGFVAIAVASLLASCGGSPRLLSVPFDPGGRSLNSSFADISPRVSGRYIVFVSDRRNSQDIYLYDFVDRRLIDLPGLNSLEVVASSPDVSDNGRYIVFAGSRRGETNIYFYDQETRQVRNLTENLRAEVRNPTISADGNTIAFEASTNGQWDVVVYDRFGRPLNVPTTPF